MITTRTTDPERVRRADDGLDPVLDALAALDAVLAELPERAGRMRRRVTRMTAEREAGRSHAEIQGSSPGPNLLELVTATTRELERAGADLRRAEARALHDEGLTMDQIAERFGVTRQRISAVLRRG